MSITDGLRPTTLDEFGGQDDLSRRVRIILDAAKVRDELCDHLLFAGPPGLGKTTLSHIVASELGVPLLVTSGPVLERPGDLAGLLSGMGGPTVVFIDEIHRLPNTVEEILYSAMEDGVIDLTIGEGIKARPLRMPLAPFTLVGATTQSGMLSAPLRSRFGFIGRLRPYDTDALTKIVVRSAALLGLDIDDAGAAAIAARSRGTPRIANSLLDRTRDWCQHIGATRAGEEEVVAAMEAFGVDPLGLDGVDRDILTALCVSFGGMPVGLGTLAAAVGETPETVEVAYEPFLLNSGMLVRTPRGRQATEAAYRHLGIEPGKGRPAAQLGFDVFDAEGDADDDRAATP